MLPVASVALRPMTIALVNPMSTRFALIRSPTRPQPPPQPPPPTTHGEARLEQLQPPQTLPQQQQQQQQQREQQQQHKHNGNTKNPATYPLTSSFQIKLTGATDRNTKRKRS